MMGLEDWKMRHSTNVAKEALEMDRLDRAEQMAVVVCWLLCDGRGFAPPQRIMSVCAGDIHLSEGVEGLDGPMKTAVAIFEVVADPDFVLGEE